MQIIKYDVLKNGCNHIKEISKEKKSVESNESYFGTMYILGDDACIESPVYDIFAKRYSKNEFTIYAAFNKEVLMVLNPGILIKCDDMCVVERKTTPIEMTFFGLKPRELVEIPAGFCQEIDNEKFCYSVRGLAVEHP